jgi:hypothetical protein
MQRFLISSSLSIDFQQAGAHCLLADVSIVIFQLVVPVKLRKDIFSFAQYLTLREACLPSSCFIQVRVARPGSRRGGLGQDLPALPAEQDPLPHQDPASSHTCPPSGLFPTFTSTWWACYNLLIIAISYLPSLTLHPTG